MQRWWGWFSFNFRLMTWNRIQACFYMSLCEPYITEVIFDLFFIISYVFLSYQGNGPAGNGRGVGSSNSECRWLDLLFVQNKTPAKTSMLGIHISSFYVLLFLINNAYIQIRVFEGNLSLTLADCFEGEKRSVIEFGFRYGDLDGNFLHRIRC